MSSDLLAQQIAAAAAAPLPPAAMRAAKRTLVNVCGTAVGASRHRVIETLVAMAREHGGTPVAAFPARAERSDVCYSALVSGTSAQLFDYDDTQLSTVLHPGAAPFGALFALVSSRTIGGERALSAYALGCEVAMRVASALGRAHYEAGWHVTGTAGVIGAAVTAAVLLDGGVRAIADAIGIAASETIGQREAFGTASKTLHGGKASANGVIAALLGREGFTSTGSLQTPRGYFTAFSGNGPVEPHLTTEGFGERWELETNTFKPYPCGIVVHPAIDAALALHAAKADPGNVREVRVICHPLVAELTGIMQPRDELQAVFSVAHGVAVGWLDGAAGLAQYRPERVTAADVSALRAKVVLRVDPALAPDAAALEIEFADCTTRREAVEHARGSLARPLTDRELEEKVTALVEPVLPGRTTDIVRAVRELERAPDASVLVRAMTLQGVAA